MNWRAMQAEDMGAVSGVSDAVHGHYTEPRAVYAERRELYPAGCFVFDTGGVVTGYLIVHPWRHEAPPALGAMIDSLPDDADCLYLHDLALLPDMRGSGAGAAGTRLALDLALAGGFDAVYLLAVGGADAFWASRGFSPVPDAMLAARLRDDYGPEVVYMRRMLAERADALS